MYKSNKNKNSLLLFDTERDDVNHMIETEAMRNKNTKSDFYLTSMIKKHKTEISTSNYDAIGAKIAYRKYLLVRTNMGFICLMALIFNLASFAITYYEKEPDSVGNKGLMISVMGFKIIVVLLYLKSFELWGSYMKKTEILNQNDDIFYEEGYYWIALKAFVLLIHPIYWLDGIKIQPFKESYYGTDDRFTYFVRDVNLYLYLIQFAVLFWVIFMVFLENTEYSATRSQRICRMFGFDNDILFIIKCILAKQGGLFVFCTIISIMFYFATLLNISEIGYVLSLEPEMFDSYEVYSGEIVLHSKLTTYYNTFWHVLITITTIGYGDMVVRAYLSRVIIFTIALAGAIIMPVLVVTVSNLFALMRSEANSIDLFHKVKAKQQVKAKAAYLVTHLMKLRVAKKHNDSEKVVYYTNQVAIHRKEFSKELSNYKNQFFITEIGDLMSRIDKTEQKYLILRNHFLPFVLKAKESSQNSISIPR